MKRRSIILAATSTLAALTLVACSGNTNKNIATMRDGTITVFDLHDEAKLESSSQLLVQRMIICEVFNSKYGGKVTDKQVDAEYDKQTKSLDDTSESQLETVGYTEDSCKECVRNNLAFEAGLRAHIDITDDDLKAAWESFHPEVEAQVIKLSSKDEAKDVKRSTDDGDDFSKLAEDKSADPETKEDGDRVRFDSAAATIPTEVKEAAFKSKDGGVSGVITATNTTSYVTEYYVIKMVRSQNKDNNIDKYKDRLKEIATEIKLSDNAFTTKIIGEELKGANVRIKDDVSENVLSAFTTTSSDAKDSDEATSLTKSSNTRSTDSTKGSSTEETTDSSK